MSLQIDLNTTASISPSMLAARLWSLAGGSCSIGEVRLHDLKLVVMDLEWLKVMRRQELRLVEQREGRLLGGWHAVRHFCRVETLNTI